MHKLGLSEKHFWNLESRRMGSNWLKTWENYMLRLLWRKPNACQVKLLNPKVSEIGNTSYNWGRRYIWLIVGKSDYEWFELSGFCLYSVQLGDCLFPEKTGGFFLFTGKQSQLGDGTVVKRGCKWKFVRI